MSTSSAMSLETKPVPMRIEARKRFMETSLDRKSTSMTMSTMTASISTSEVLEDTPTLSLSTSMKSLEEKFSRLKALSNSTNKLEDEISNGTSHQVASASYRQGHTYTSSAENISEETRRSNGHYSPMQRRPIVVEKELKSKSAADLKTPPPYRSSMAKGGVDKLDRPETHHIVYSHIVHPVGQSDHLVGQRDHLVGEGNDLVGQQSPQLITPAPEGFPLVPSEMGKEKRKYDFRNKIRESEKPLKVKKEKVPKVKSEKPPKVKKEKKVKVEKLGQVKVKPVKVKKVKAAKEERDPNVYRSTKSDVFFDAFVLISDCITCYGPPKD